MTMKMRGVVLVMVMGGAAVQGFAQGTSSTVKDDLFAGTEMFATGASDVTEITMDPDSLGMVGGSHAPRAHSMVLNVVRTYTYDKPGMYKIEDVEKFRAKLMTGDWHCSVHTRSTKSGESTDVCNKRRTDDMNESAIITVEPKELTFIHTITKKGPGEQGEMGDVMMLRGMHGMTSLAAIDPQAFVDMEMASARMKANGLGSLSGLYDGSVYRDLYSSSRSGQPFILKMDHMGELQKQLDSLNKQLGSVTDPAKAETLRDEAKKLQEQLNRVHPDGATKLLILPDAGSAPVVVPDHSTAPEAPAVPQ